MSAGAVTAATLGGGGAAAAVVGAAVVGAAVGGAVGAAVVGAAVVCVLADVEVALVVEAVLLALSSLLQPTAINSTAQQVHRSISPPRDRWSRTSPTVALSPVGRSRRRSSVGVDRGGGGGPIPTSELDGVDDQRRDLV